VVFTRQRQHSLYFSRNGHDYSPFLFVVAVYSITLLIIEVKICEIKIIKKIMKGIDKIIRVVYYIIITEI